jgi:hypothetical protein
MDIATLVVYAVIVLWLLAITVATARAWRARPPRLKPLSPEARGRYAMAWNRIEARFLHAPREAANEAENLVLAVLGERGHPLDRERIRAQVEQARAARAADDGRDGTEHIRQAMLHYRGVFDQLVGRKHREGAREQRREMA